MSTRAWYEYYVVDTVHNALSLAFQFYKWGDGGPENALAELAFLNEKIQSHQGQLPVVWLDDLLREQLRDLYFSLPDHFSIAAFLFLLQRANEERRRWPAARESKIPKKERPDYRLGFATGFAASLNGFQPRGHPDPHLDRVLSFVAAGHFVRRWKHYGLRLSVLQWLQYLTQPTFAQDMGSISGDFIAPRGDIHFIHRFFIWTKAGAPYLIDRMAIELRNEDGTDLLSPRRADPRTPWDDSAYQLELAEKLIRKIASLGVERYSLDAALAALSMTPDRFWRLSSYERPPINPQTECT